jgi:hypothetical protein
MLKKRSKTTNAFGFVRTEVFRPGKTMPSPNFSWLYWTSVIGVRVGSRLMPGRLTSVPYV